MRDLALAYTSTGREGGDSTRQRRDLIIYKFGMEVCFLKYCSLIGFRRRNGINNTQVDLLFL